MKLINKLKANMVFSIDTASFFKSIWIGPLLITWCADCLKFWYETIEVTWYGFDYWMPQEVSWDE